MNKGKKQERLAHANALIKVISEHGRRFFWNESRQIVASLEIDVNGCVWFIDDYRGIRIFTNKKSFCNGWRGFSHGDTLRHLIEMMRDYIMKGKQISRKRIATTREMDGGYDMWGYGPEAVKAVREAAFLLPIIAPVLGGDAT